MDRPRRDVGSTRAAAAARVFIGLNAVVIAFQLALVAGAPWGALTMGGTFPGQLPTRMRAVALAGLTELHIVGSMHERKALMASLSDAFIALPGGWGTLEEFFEVLTWAQLGLHPKPCGLLNIEGFYDTLLALVDHAIAERFVRPEHRALVVEARDPTALLNLLADYRPPSVEKWICSPDET